MKKKKKVPPANWNCTYCGKKKVYYNTWEDGKMTPACWDDFIKHRKKEGVESINAVQP